MLSAAEEYVHAADAEISTLDGYRLEYSDSWVLVRPSGTEPKIRIVAEATTADRAEELATDLADVVRAAVE
jgi:phosphomannomutase/phosphoglucomutase